MNTTKAKSLMIPLSVYPTVSENATLGEAIAALREAQAGLDRNKHPHRAVLIFDKHQNLAGKVNFLSALRGLEPKYEEMLSDTGPWHLGFTRKFQKAMFESMKLWQDPLEQICRKSARIKVRSFMVKPQENEMIEADAPLGEAVHQMVIGHHQSLLVTAENRIVGVLRLTDVFEAVADVVTACSLAPK